MSYINRHLTLFRLSTLLTVFSLSISTLLFSSIAAVHPDSPAVLQTVFGEHLSHWLITHQGYITV